MPGKSSPRKLQSSINQTHEDPVLREIISRITSCDGTSADIQRIKIAVCRQYGISAVPKNSAILAAAADEAEREAIRGLLQVKPTRTISGVAPVAVMTSPYPCPHGRCLPCPGGPLHRFGSPQSYTGEEPAAMRGRQHCYDPYRQVEARLTQFSELGHPVDKVEVIVMGGTITARDPAYQAWFLRGCIRAMNEYSGVPETDGLTFEELARQNERSDVRCIAITYETRPDWCSREHIDTMLSSGVTKVELGAQHLEDTILTRNRRGHSVADTAHANCLLRDAGLKVGFHVMPNLPGAGLADDELMFSRLFGDERFRPDFLKIYPTLVTPDSEIEQLWQQGVWESYREDVLIDLLARAKAEFPPYVRLQRIQRDIPAKLITAGSRHSNFRQLVKARMDDLGLSCRCIRCREVGRSSMVQNAAVSVVTYDCCGGTEHFIQSAAGDVLIGFARLRFPKDPWRPEIQNAALLRELHVYGSLVRIGGAAREHEWQHRHHGAGLLGRAETIAAEAGYDELAVMSGIGVRPYYRRHGYSRRGPYMVKRVS